MEERHISLYGEQKIPWHKEVIDDDHRFKIIVAGRKARKTSLIIRELFKGAFGSDLTFIYFAPFRKQAKEICWDDHVAMILNILNENGIKYKKNDSELSIDIQGAGKVVVDGLDNSEAHRGKSNWGGVGLDEWATSRPDVWEPIIRPNLMVHKAWGIFGGTPRGYNHFWRLAKRGDHNNIIEGESLDSEGNEILTDKDFMTFRYSSYDNPYNDTEELDSIRANGDPLWFDQEYLARFTKFTGLIYKDFDRQTHTIKPFEIPDEWKRYRSIDLGSDDPTVCLWIARDPEWNVYIYREYYKNERATEDHAEEICLESAKEEYNGTIFDHHGLGKQLIVDYNRLGVKGTEHQNHKVAEGIERVKELVKPQGFNGKPKLFVFDNCFNTIREFESYQWDKRAQERDPELNSKQIPLDKWNHAMDCLKNWTMTFYYTRTPTEKEIKDRRARRELRKVSKYKVSPLTNY